MRVLADGGAGGVRLGPALASLVAPDAAGLAASILRLHRDQALHAECRREGLEHIATVSTEERTAAALREALGKEHLPDQHPAC